MAKDPYNVLGIDKEADQDQIKRAYRRSAKKYHPDTTCPEANSKKFIELKEAYETLSDKAKRRAYDRTLKGESIPIRVSTARARSGRAPGFRRRSRLWGVMEDPFGGFFHDVTPLGRDVSPKGEEIYLEAVLTPEEARQGGVFPVAIPVRLSCPQCSGSSGWDALMCPLCSGTGSVQIEKRFSMRIPPWIQDNTVLRFFVEETGAQVNIVVHVESV